MKTPDKAYLFLVQADAPTTPDIVQWKLRRTHPADIMFVNERLVKGLEDALELAEKKIERRYPMGRDKNLLLEHIRAALDNYREAVGE